MRFKALAAFGLPAVLFIAACATDGSTEGTTGAGGNGAGGSSNATGGSSSGEGGSSQSTGGTTGSTGGHVGSTGGATGSTGGTTGGGTGGHVGTGGATGATGGATGDGTGGQVGTGGTTGATGGTTGSTGGTTGATGGSTGNTSPSGYAPPPGSANVPKPSGSPGNITVLNWAGFKGAVSYSFDDDNDTQISNYSTLNGYGVPLTFYMWGNRTEASNSVWGTAVKNGHEIGNHTWSHQSTPPGGVSDITQDTTFIMQKWGVTPHTMAAPNGAATYTQLAPTASMMTNRGVADAIIKPNDNTDRYTLPCYIPPTGGTASANFNPEVDAAQSAGGWRIILVHGFTGGTDGAYQPVPLTEFTAGVQHTKSLGNMWIDRVDNVASYWLGQKAISSATKTTSGSSTTWTWTLPSNFAPGKYVRITVPGGTVTQNGVAIPWDPHGYYEIALGTTTGSVTVGP